MAFSGPGALNNVSLERTSSMIKQMKTVTSSGMSCLNSWMVDVKFKNLDN